MAIVKRPNMNTHVLVRNLNGTSDNFSRCCGAWKKHWEAHSGESFGKCAVHDCSNPATVGAHVMELDDRSGFEWWIVPFCSSHNSQRYNGAELYIDKETAMIQATRMPGCLA